MAIPVIGYVRVSRVGGRGGDSFLSPELQREAIDRECKRSGLELVEVYEELDASGGDNSRVLWNKAIDKVETGQAKGIVVWNLSRFSRSTVDALNAIDRIESAGGAIYSASGDVGDNTPTGKLTRTIFLGLAQMERERARDGFRAAQGNAIDRGLFTASHIPVGYLRERATRKLVPDPVMAPVVRELFERRARGDSWKACARWFMDNGGSMKTGHSAIKWIIQNPTYLGHSRSGEFVNKNAHPAIVSTKLYDEANGRVGNRPTHDGSLTSQTLLRGLIRCESCGHRLGITRFRSGQAGYTCLQLACPARAGVRAIDIDTEVVSWVTTFVLKGSHKPTFDAYQPTTSEDREEARKALEEAQYDRQLFIGSKELRRLMSADEYAAELESLNELVAEAQIAYSMTDEAEAAVEVVNFQEVWDSWTDESRREWLNTVLDCVIVKSANRRRVPVTSRMAVGFKYAGDVLWLNADGSWSDVPFGETLLHSELISPLADMRPRR